MGEQSSTSPVAPRPSRRCPVILVAAAFGALVAGSVVLARSPGDSAGRPSPARPGIEVAVTAMDRTIGPANNSPTLLADPGDPRFVVMANRLDAPDFSCALHVSGDSGRGWAPVNPVAKLPAGAEKCYAPEIAFDAKGVLYYLFVGLAGKGNEPMGAFLTTSADRGRTFSEPARVLGPLNFAVRMAIDRDQGGPGRLHLVWIEVRSDPTLGGFPPPPNPVLAKHSDDGGRTFSEPAQVNDPERARVVAPSLALGPGGTVHVAYYDLGDDAVDYQGLEGSVWDGTWSVVLATSTDGGRRFAERAVVEAEVAPPERVMLIFTMTPPALAVRDERVCAAWTDARRGDADVLARCSGDGGRRFGPARRLNDDKVGNGLSQFMPRLAFSPDGRLDAIFYDRRREPHNVLNYVFLTYSADGGRTWAPNVRLSRHASSSLVGQRYANPSAKGMVEFGSRLGLISGPRSAVAAWADTRNSRPDSTGQDVFTTVAQLPAASGGRSLGTVAGWGLLAAGAAGILLGWRGLRRRPGAVVAAAALLTLGACSSDATEARRSPPAPAAAPVVNVTMRDHRFELDRDVPVGRVVFQITNAGREPHHLTMIPVPEDLPPIAEQLRGTQRRFVQPYAGIYDREPGDTGTFAVDLVPGRRYAMVCAVVAPDGQPHWMKGMATEFRTPGAPPAAADAATPPAG